MGGWAVETLDATVTAEIEALPAEVRARLTRTAALIQEQGLERIGWPHIKHLEGKLWEIRLKGRDAIARALYVTASGRRVVIVRVFIKKSQKTPRHEIALALRRARAVA
jgi:phage-related protein